jgi:hypothetical protein
MFFYVFVLVVNPTYLSAIESREGSVLSLGVTYRWKSVSCTSEIAVEPTGAQMISTHEKRRFSKLSDSPTFIS